MNTRVTLLAGLILSFLLSSFAFAQTDANRARLFVEFSDGTLTSYKNCVYCYATYEDDGSATLMISQGDGETTWTVGVSPLVDGKRVITLSVSEQNRALPEDKQCFYHSEDVANEMKLTSVSITSGGLIEGSFEDLQLKCEETGNIIKASGSFRITFPETK